MADFTTTYREVEPETLFSDRRRDVAVVDGPASFLALAVKLGVPVLSTKQLSGGGTRSAGGGLSFAVARTTSRMKLRKGIDWANNTLPEWFNRVESRGSDSRVVIVKNHVNKRILFHHHLERYNECENDARTLVAMTTEMRILAHGVVRKSVNVVSLVAISWSKRETNGRFWPEMLLEGAQHGNVNEYLQISRDLDSRSKVLMVMDIAAGLAFLHENGIVHGDVKPGNLLVCDSHDRKALESIGTAPVIVKLCDFGCSVILSDYPENHQFLINVGTPEWMAPEIKQCLPIESAMLIKSDIYSLGLVAATIFTGQKPSYDDVLPRDITLEELPDAKDNSESAVTLSVRREEKSNDSTKRKLCVTGNEEQMSDLKRTRHQKSDTNSENSKSNSNIKMAEFISSSVTDTLMAGYRGEEPSALLRHIHSATLQPKQSYRKEAREIYELCRTNLLQEGSREEIEILSLVIPGCPDKNDKDSKVEIKSCEARVPDFAFENSIRTGLLPRECRKEVVRDLERSVSNNNSDSGQCAFQLAALISNGYWICESDMVGKEVERYLSYAVASSNQLAISGAINIMDAMGREVHQDMRRQVLHRFQDFDFRLEAVSEIKSLFFPLSFGSINKPVATGAQTFPFAHRYNIQERLIAVQTWEREFKEDFNAFLLSREYHQLLSVVSLSLLGPVRIDWIPPDKLKLSNSMMVKYIYTSSICLGNMTSHEQDIFIGEVLESEIVDNPTEVGLTLLQLAVCRGDEAAASMLIDTLGADVDAYGNTFNLTPLWIACFLGYVEMACLLIRYGADLTCTDSSQGLTVLHLLSQFTAKDGVEGIGCQALVAGVDINAKCKNGITPLLAIMLVFDYSNGAATQFLLENGANPLDFTLAVSEAYDLPVSPLAICVLNLDIDLFEQMLDGVIHEHSGDMSKDHELALSILQEVGFQLMRSQTTFSAMYKTGSKYRTSLKRILQKIVNVKPTNTLWMSTGCTHLSYAFEIDRADIMEYLLAIGPNVPLEIPILDRPYKDLDFLKEAAPEWNLSNKRVISMLGDSIVRRNSHAVNALIRHGADLLKPTGINDTSLSQMAKEMPSMLLETLDYLETHSAAGTNAKTTKEILEMQQFDCAGIFDCILLNGNSEDLNIADTLRIKYELNHDSVQPFPPNTTTLMGSLIIWSVSYGYDRLTQIRYLLSLKPKPRLLMPCGVNLFSLALVLSDESKSNECLEVFRLLLHAYPEVENLTQGWRQLLPALHKVASGTNLEVLQLMQEHVELKYPEKRFPYNHIHLRNTIPAGHALLTMLDCCRFSVVVPNLDPTNSILSTRHKDKEDGSGAKDENQDEDEKDIFGLSAFDKSKQQNNRIRMSQYLREQGAVYGWELDGYFISGRFLLANSLSVDDFRGFLEKITKKYCLGPWEHGPEPDKEFPATWFPYAWRNVEESYSRNMREATKNLADLFPHISAGSALKIRKTQLRICELVWRGNNFCLRAWDLPFSSTWLETGVPHYFSTRVWERSRWTCFSGATPPYESTNYCENFVMSDNDEIITMPYTRHGRVWTESEVNQLSDDIFSQWAVEFSQLEEGIPDELRAAVMSYF